jgi:putative SOS response-associated peptidase YedK
MAPIHNRMAVILQPGDESKWLDVGHASCEQLQPISTSYQRI